jgi:hypothetical protein
MRSGKWSKRIASKARKFPQDCSPLKHTPIEGVCDRRVPVIFAAGETLIVAVGAILALIILSAPFLMYWPWRWADKRTIAKYMAEYGNSLVEMEGRCWAKWVRVAAWTWIPVRKYAIVYAGQDGRTHQATATFYLPRWLNKMYDSGFEGHFDLVEVEDSPDVHG